MLKNVRNFSMQNSAAMKKIVWLICLFSACAAPKGENQSESPEVPELESAEVINVSRDARTIGPEKSPEQKRIDEAIEKIKSTTNNDLIGYWVGMFGKNKINIALAEISDQQAIGYTVCAGNFRPITGKVTKRTDSTIELYLDEPGTDSYDGHFEMTIQMYEKILTGKWTPFQPTTSAKTFQLAKTEYTYRTDTGTYPEASARLLNEDDVANLLEEELAMMRNEIYARHGYSFKEMAERRHFDAQSWYIPMGIDIRSNLTDIEVRNIDLIYQYEDYYQANYDDYGR
jgi:YARHG domain